MKFSIKKIAASAIFFFIGSLFSLWAENPQTVNSSLQDFCFEIVNGCVNRNLPQSHQDSGLYEISKNSCRLLTQPVFTRNGQVYVIEIIFPQKTGLIDSAFSYQNLIPQPEETHPDWIETIVYALAKEGADFDYDIDPSVFDSLNGRNEKGEISQTNEEITETSLATAEGTLRHFSYGVENLTKSRNCQNIVLTDEADGLVRRRTYSPDNMILKYEEFNTGDKAKDLTEKCRKEFFYDDENKLVQTVEEIFIDKAKVILDFNEKNKVSRRRQSHTIDEKNYNDSDVTFEYDENGNEVSVSGQNWYWEKDRSGRYKAKSASYRKTWDYSKFSDKPDYEYFENNSIRMRTVYVSEKVYNETMYFDNDISVETTYEDGVKILERILLKGKEQRRTVFEKQ